MNWGQPYQMTAANYMGVSQPSNMGAASQMEQYSLAANFAQINQQAQQFHQMQQQMLPQFNQGNSVVAAGYLQQQSNMPQQQLQQSNMPQQQLQQSNFSASWPLEDNGNNTGRSNSAMGQFDSGNKSGRHSNLATFPREAKAKVERKVKEVVKEPQTAKQPEGAGWPLEKRTDVRVSRKRSPPIDDTRKIQSSSCPICHNMIPLEEWVSHATSHASPAHDSPQGTDVDYFFFPDLLKRALSRSELIKSYSCQFCNVQELEFEEMLKHIQDSEHAHAIYRWLVQPWTVGHERYKDHVPQIPIRNRHYKFHFCELCLQLAGWNPNDMTRHSSTKTHLARVQKMREDLQWMEKGYAMRTECKLRDNQNDLPKSLVAASDLPPPLFQSERSRDDDRPHGRYDAGDTSRNYSAMKDQGTYRSYRSEQQSLREAGSGTVYEAASRQEKPEYKGRSERYHGGSGLEKDKSAYERSSGKKIDYGRQDKGRGGTVSTVNDEKRGRSRHRRVTGGTNHKDTAYLGIDSKQAINTGTSAEAPEKRSFRESSDRPGLTVLNRGKLQEIVHSIRSTSAAEAHPVNADPDAARSKAAVLAMLKGDNAIDAKYMSKPLDYGHMSSSQRFLSEKDRSGIDQSSNAMNDPKASEALLLRESQSTERLAYTRRYDNHSTPYHSLDPFADPTPRLDAGVLELVSHRSYSPSKPTEDRIYVENIAQQREASPQLRKTMPSLERQRSPLERKVSPSRQRGSTDRKKGSPQRYANSPERYRRSLERRQRSLERRRRSLDRHRSSPEKRRRSSDRHRRSPDRRRRSPDKRRRSPDRRRRSLDRRRVSSERRKNSPSESLAQRDRTPVRSRRSPDRKIKSNRASPSLTRAFPPTKHMKPHQVEKDQPNNESSNKKPKRRLSPVALDPLARDELTRKIENTWQKYYHKYYSCVMTNPEIVLELQKEYLRSYKGFFKEDPYFEFYYTKVAKPEDLREALTLRINRASPGPDPNESAVETKASSPLVIMPTKNREMPKSPKSSTLQVSSNRQHDLSTVLLQNSNVNAAQMMLQNRNVNAAQIMGNTLAVNSADNFLKSSSRGSWSVEKQVLPKQVDREKVSPSMRSPNLRKTIQNMESSHLPPPVKTTVDVTPKPDELPNLKTQLDKFPIGDRRDLNAIARSQDTDKNDGIFSETGGVRKRENSSHEDRFKEREDRDRFQQLESNCIKEVEADKVQYLEGDNRFKGRDDVDRFKGLDQRPSVMLPAGKDATVVDMNVSPDKRYDSGSPGKKRVQNDPVITSTTQGFPFERKRSQPEKDRNSSKPRSVLGRLGPQRKTSNTAGQEEGSSLSHSSNSAKEHRRSSHHDRRKDERNLRKRLGPSETKKVPSESTLTEMFTDPFLAFVHKTLTGIILIGQYQESMATSTEPAELLAKINQEQEDMQARMVTADGHLLIQLARCCVEDPENIEKTFPKVNADLGPILRNLDKQVVTLIADTPIIINQPKRPSP